MATVYSPNIVKNGLVFCMDAGNGKSYPGSGTTINDLVSPSSVGTFVNGPTFDSGNGGSIVFDGVDSYVSSLFTINTITNVTIQCWVFIPDTNEKGSFVRIGSGGDGYSIGVGQNTFDNSGNEIIGLFPVIRWIDTNTTYGTGWKFVTLILDASSVPSIYLNTTLIGSYPGANPISPTAGLYLGRTVGNEAGTPRAFGGRIAIATVYNRILSVPEITQNFNANRKRFEI